MRLNRLGLLRFGKFTDRVVDLPYARPDLHLIVGPNEAGKSTLRSAISELLFGIEAKTPFNFLHGYTDLRLSAVVEDDGQRIDCQRLKRMKQSLRDANDEPLPDDALAAVLGGASREFFERMFGLDHGRLVAGGLAILEAKDDVGRVLFETSAGLTTLGPVRDELEREAKSLWDKRRAGDRAYYKALDAFKTAEDSLKNATIRAKVWRDIERDCEDAEQALAEAKKHHEELEAERARLERIRRVAPHVEHLDDARRKQEALQASVAVADRRLLDHETEVEALEALCHRVKDYPQQIQNRRSEIDTLARSAATIAGQLGLATTDLSILAERLPSHVVRSELVELVKSESAVTAALEASVRALADRQADLEVLIQDLTDIAASGASPALRIALDAARGLGDVERQKRDIAALIDKERRKYETATGQLAPWSGSVPQLRTLSLPSEESVRATQQREADVRRALRDAEAGLQDVTEEITRSETAAASLRDARKAVSLDDIVEARRERDTCWESIRKSPQELSVLAPVYEAAVSAADDVADRRYNGAADAGRLEALREALHALKARQHTQERAIAAARRDLADLVEQWSESTKTLEPFRPSPAAMLDWLRARTLVLGAADALEAAELALADLTRSESETGYHLRATLAAEGADLASAERLPLRGLVAFAADLVERAEADKTRRAEMESRRRKEQIALELLAKRMADEQAKRVEWERRWTQSLQDAGLAPGTSPAAAAKALEMLAQLDQLSDKIKDIERSRIDTMQRDLRSFADEAARLAGEICPDLVDGPADHVAAELTSRLRAAVRARDEAERLAKEIERATRAAGDAGDGLPFERLEKDVACEDRSTITARLGSIDESLREAVKRREECSDRRSRAEAARSAIHGQDDAASAEARRQQAIAEMADVTERFVKVYVAGRLLRWSIDRYREEKQGPLLRRAGEIFATLTLGSFDRLSVDFEGDTPQLVARRPQGALVGVAGMSEGTRDQLYLALRLAAVELHLAHGRPLPFVADDLFINYDDVRAAAGFKALADLATRTQVIFLTHHEHLVSVARDAVGDDLDVVTL